MNSTDPSAPTNATWRAAQGGLSPEAKADAGLQRALDRAAMFFKDRTTRAAVMARRALGRRHPPDQTLIEHLVRELRRRTRMDGSVEGSLVRTAWTVAELLDLDCPADHAAVVRTVGYVLTKQNGPGHFAEGCSEERHRDRLCRHYIEGFFTPGPRDEDLAPLKLPTGVTFADEEDARFAASCLALRVAIRAGEDRRESVRRHIESLLSLPEMWDDWAGRWSPDLTLLALGALAAAPMEYRAEVDRRVAFMLGHQREDGTWRDAYFLHALEVLLAFPTAGARAGIARAAQALVERQRADGSFDDDSNEEATLVGLRSLQVGLQR